ncbi:MAG: hypothetical protein R2851_05810 [Caldilineaceae bacterium]
MGAPAMEYADYQLPPTVAAPRPPAFTSTRPRRSSRPASSGTWGMVVIYLRIIEWQIPDFDVTAIVRSCTHCTSGSQGDGSFDACAHRFLIQAHKPA